MVIKILLADDHKILRESLRQILNEEPGLEVVAEAQDGREAIALAKETRPDIILMDITMPNVNGIEAARRILRERPEVKILILSMHAIKPFVEDAFRSGIHGYLLKNCAISEVVAAIKTILEGKYYISPDIAGIVVHDYIHPAEEKSPMSVLDISPREMEILHRICDGETTKKIAESLFISEKTVEVHRKHILQKMDCHNVAELIKKAIQLGIIIIPPNNSPPY